ncbi:helix-turn-helix domain-containing protein [bacterium]|nr:helix-turn-helix domain-containing protein [bacterium]MCK4326428.1 helix-turn-helix domain-containing protein [bacterium]MCK4436895.1 helix-turn-helix domain-containing protein [bacterium]
MAEEPYLSREDVLKLLKVDQAKLNDLIKQGKLEPTGEGDLAKFKEDDVVNYMTEESPGMKEETAPGVKEEKAEEKSEAVTEEPPFLATPEEEKPSEEGKTLPLGEEKPIRIEPKEARPSPFPPKEEETVEMPGIKEEEVRPEAEVKEEPSIPPARPARAEVALPVTKKKAGPFFSFLFILSLLLILSAIGILLLPILEVPIPAFLKPALRFANRIF